LIYVFECKGREHEGERVFEKVVHFVGKNVINQVDCKCGAVAQRRFDKEIPTQALVGCKPISHASSVKGTVAKEVEYAFGQFKKNPDGTFDKNHRPFADTGELNKFLNGANEYGKPKINQSTGQPLRRKDGSVVREGTKLFKYGPNDTPSRDTVRRSRPNYGCSVEAGGNPKDFPDT
jgi:hypothetical protein